LVITTLNIRLNYRN